MVITCNCLGLSFRKERNKVLHEFFKRNQHPSSEEIAILGCNLGMETPQVLNWFTYQRAKLRKKASATVINLGEI